MKEIWLIRHGDGAETFVALVNRARQTLERIRRLDDDFAAIFTHGLFVRSLLWVQLVGSAEIDTTTMRRFRSFIAGFAVPNGSILKLHVNRERELFFGDFITAHLSESLK